MRKQLLNIQVETMAIAMPSCKWLLWLAWGLRIHRGEVLGTRGKICWKHFPLEGGCLRAREKWSFLECYSMVKMIPSEQARRTENVGFGIT